MKHWYAVYCKPREDARAALHLTNQGYEIFRPLARVRHRTSSGVRHRVESLFPRYVFIRLDDCDQSWAPIRSTRGVACLVRLGGHLPTAVPAALVDSLRRRMADNGWIDLDDVRTLCRNEPIVIIDGAFAGCDAIFECHTAAERVVVLLSLLGGTRRLEIPEQSVARAGT